MTTPDSDRTARLLQLFGRCLELDAAGRATLLDHELAGEPELRDALQRMLTADATTGTLDARAVDLVVELDIGADAGDGHEDHDALGTLLGHWRLESVLGRGGMGTVFAARREDGSGQRAALKRLHRRWDGSLQAQRFAQEQQILAALSHPHLPRLIDRGTDAEGRPWFALEYVDGLPLTAWADAHALDLRARISLLRRVCAAVQHAHERFVVHRDLKPANILVDAEGFPKVLDFGVAKRTDDAPGATRTGHMVGFTPEYAAPEQLTGGTISAATDVHALGVILYELLSGQLPHRFDQHNLKDVADTITTRSALQLEKAITGGTAEDAAMRFAQRRTDARGFHRFVKGDLSRIVQTALAKEPERRYSSVQALSNDLQRFLDGRTVSVGGDTLRYRARKFAQRNRWGVLMGTVAAIALLAATGFSLHRAHAERLARERSEAVLDYVSSLFSPGADGRPHANQIDTVEMLDRASARIDQDFRNDAMGRAHLLKIVGDAYIQMGLPARGETWLRRSLAASKPLRGDDPGFYLDQLRLLADALNEQDRHADVVALLEHSPSTPSLRRRLGFSRSRLGDMAGAEADLRSALGAMDRDPASDPEEHSSAYNDLALIVSDRGHYAEALTLLRKVDALQRAMPQSSRYNRLINRLNQGRELHRLGRYDEAVAMLAPTLGELETLAGADNARAITLRNLLSQSYAARGDYPLARQMVQRNLELLKSSDPEDLALSRLTLAKLLTYDGRPAEALPLTETGLRDMRARYPQPTMLRGRAYWITGETLLRLNRCADATPMLETALADETAQSGATFSANAGEALDSLGRCRLLQGDAAGAQALLARASAQFEGVFGNDHPRSLRSRAHLLWAQTLQDPRHAEALRTACKRLRAAVAGNQALLRQIEALEAQPEPAQFTGLNSLS